MIYSCGGRSLDLISWLARYFRGTYSKQTGESNFPCPRCKHHMFYFNVKKQVGYCHRDRCHWKPTLADLVQIVGHGPEDSFGAPNYEGKAQRSDLEIVLPEGSQKLVDMVDGKLVEPFPHASEEVAKRGVDRSSQYLFNLHLGNGRVYIPVYHNGKMISYVGRTCWWLPLDASLKYKYPKGIRVTDYLFNWDMLKQAEQLTLVENTFNAIWIWNNLTGCTSTFGSNLSDRQIELISQGEAKSVVIMWDEGADHSAAKAVKKLKAKGVRATYLKIHGQPDDHALDYIDQMILDGYAAAADGTDSLKYRK